MLHPFFSETEFERFNFFEDFLVVASARKSKIDEELVEKVQYSKSVNWTTRTGFLSMVISMLRRLPNERSR
jgi:hypothetical protein